MPISHPKQSCLISRQSISCCQSIVSRLPVLPADCHRSFPVSRITPFVLIHPPDNIVWYSYAVYNIVPAHQMSHSDHLVTGVLTSSLWDDQTKKNVQTHRKLPVVLIIKCLYSISIDTWCLYSMMWRCTAKILFRYPLISLSPSSSRPRLSPAEVVPGPGYLQPSYSLPRLSSAQVTPGPGCSRLRLSLAQVILNPG